MKNFKYVIFDMDGTILDSMNEWKNLGKNYLVGRGIKVPENINEIINSLTVNEATQYFQKEYGLKESVEEINTAIIKMIEHKFRHELMLKPFVREYLQKLKNNDVKMCVATATPVDLAMQALKRLDVIDYFSFVVCCDDVGIGKTMPDIYHYAAEKFGAEPNEIMVFEDSDYAMKTSKNAGYYTVAVFDENTDKTRKELEMICDKYIESFEELL